MKCTALKRERGWTKCPTPLPELQGLDSDGDCGYCNKHSDAETCVHRVLLSLGMPPPVLPDEGASS
jgi:hypothetical protein